MNNHGYNICFLDILGFSDKISQDGGLEKIKSKYIQLTETIRSINDRYKEVISKGFLEGSYWSNDGIGLFYKTNVIYGSDSIIIWSDRTWDNFKKVTDVEKIHPSSMWESFPKACDPFLQICNEIICKSIELDLPLRGALSLGDAYFDFEKYIFIGKPIVEAATLEKIQDFIGASFCISFENQIIPKRFSLGFDNYIKRMYKGKELIPACYTNQNVIDWPRHWRNTRTENLVLAIEKIDFGNRDDIKQNTLRFITKSEQNNDNFIAPKDVDIMSVYRDYYDNCGLPIRLMWHNNHWTFGDFHTLNSYFTK